MAKKPEDQTSTNGANGGGDAVDLETELDDDATGGSDSDDEDDDDEDDAAGSGGKPGALSVQAQITKAVDDALARSAKQFQSEMDRRINSALAKAGTKKPASKDDDEEDGGKVSGQAAPVADVRGARLSFREYLPDSIKLLSAEEKTLANEYGQHLIRSRALQGFEDEDQTGREVAEATAAFLKKARDLYSSRTKRVLEKQGALVKQTDGRGPGGGTPPPASMQSAYDAALKKDMQLFPERYKDQLQK